MVSYGGMAYSVSVGPFKIYAWVAVKNGARYLYAQIYLAWNRRKTVYLGKDVGEVAGKIVSATAELGRAVSWSPAEKVTRRLLEEFAVVKAVYNALRAKARERGRQATLAALARDVIGATIDVDAVETEGVEVDPYEVARRLESLGETVMEYLEYLNLSF
ncbi:MAG: hypothetical protein QXU93_08075 [Thermoproteus sp.]